MPLLRTLPPFQFFQNHFVHLVDIAAAQCDDQIASLCMVADIVGDLFEVLVFPFVGGFRIAFVLREPDCIGKTGDEISVR